VDDQETARMILKQLLDAWGLEAHTAASGEDALAQIEEAEITCRPFNAVLLDWRMPDLSGLDVARRLHKNAQRDHFNHSLLVVMITAYDKEELLSQAGSIHLDGVLTKPVTPSDLFDALVKCRNPKPNIPTAINATVPVKKPPDFHGARILLVEDNAINQKVAAEFLKRRNITVFLANHGGEAVDWASRESFDAVLMDLHMPIMDGLEATRRIHELPKCRDLPIIAMTAAVMPEDRERCTACGMVGFISKPIDAEELTQVLQHWIKPGNDRVSPNGVERQTDGSPLKGTLPDSLPGFDLGQALNRLGGNRDLLARLLLNFVEEQAGAQVRLDALLEAGENAHARVLLHTLKGVAFNLGVSELARCAERLEREIKSAEPLNSRRSFARALTEAMNAISTHVLPVNERPAAEGLDRKALADLLLGLQHYLRERELVPDGMIQTLERLARNDLPDAPLARLARQIDQFDYAGAMVNITQLAATLGVELRS
jgi:CheY-like chemotaxis protein/HPt (histidine-containing phosphotransfer) domain-containing protein